MDHQKIDRNTWARGELFAFYIDRMRVVMSLTVDIDAAPLAAFAKRNGLKFYPAMIWTVSSVINRHDEFKYGWDADGNLIRWEQVWPSYAHFHPEDQAFTKMVTPYEEDLFAFHARFMRDRERCRDLRAVVPDQPPNFSMCPACPGCGTVILTCTFLTKGPSWRRWSPGAGWKRKAKSG